VSRIFDALRKAELEPNPFSNEGIPPGKLVHPHPRRRRIFEREFGLLSNAVQGYFPRASSGKIVLVLGCVEGEGASYVSSNLSRTLARTSGAPILHMDGDFHEPSLQANFSGAPTHGLSDVMASGDLNRLSGAIHTTDTSHLYVLPVGRDRISPVAVFDSEEFLKVQTSLRRTFKFIIVDGPPVLKHPDALQLASHVDGVVLVVRQNHLTREVIRKAVEQLQAVNAPLIGAILNRRRFAIPTLIYRLIS
jgi:capsular exopolysaccharide synthesis family protein